MLPDTTLNEAQSLRAACMSTGATPATADSCAGGLIATALAVGSADVLDRLVGFGPARTGRLPRTERHEFSGARTTIRAAAVAHAFSMIAAAL